MPLRRDDWILEVKTNPERYCDRYPGGLVASSRAIMRAFECSQGTATKLSEIINKTLAERNRQNQSRTKS